MWNVFDTSGNLIGSFLPSTKKFNMTREQYDQFQSVSQVLGEKAEQKAKESTAPMSKGEINAIDKWDRVLFYNNGDNILISDSRMVLALTKEQFDYVKSNIEITPTELEGIASAFDRYNKYESWGEVTEVKVAPKDVIKGGVVCVVDNKGYLFSKAYYDQLKKHSHAISVVGDSDWNFALVGYDENGKPTGIVLPIKNENQIIDGVEMYTGNNKPVTSKSKSKAVAEAKKDESIKETSKGTTKYEHLYDEDKVSKEYLDSVNKKIENAIINIRNGNLDGVPEVIEVVNLDESTIKTISDFVGYDISGYTCKIERDRLVHIEDRHGINGEHDQSLSDPKDTARMGYVLNNSDNIEWLVDDKGNQVFDSKYNDRHNKITPIFVMQKRIDGTYTVSQVVPDSKRKTLWITSARIEKADVGSQVPNADNSPQPTSKTPLVSSPASGNTIPQDTDIVNNNIDDTRRLCDCRKGCVFKI
jgi:hypothetical protein